MRAFGFFVFIIALSFLLADCSQTKTTVLTVAMSLGEEEWKVLREEIFPIFEDRYNVK
jgi:ABC-type spermidine/putrescine transport system permease subunit II